MGRAVTEAKAGKIEYRLDKANIIHVPIGKASFGAEKLGQNLSVVMEAIVKAKPAAAKGQYIKSATVASTMGPGIKLNSAKIRRLSCKLKKRAPADFQHRQQNARERAALATRPARIFRRIYAEKRGTVLCE